MVLQVIPQSMPAGTLVTVPVPDPVLLTFRVIGSSSVMAVTFCASFRVTVQVVAVPLQAPLQPLDVEPVATAAVRVTRLFILTSARQVSPQLIPAGDDVSTLFRTQS